MSPRRRTSRPWALWGSLALAALIALGGPACQSPTSPDGKGEADISVTNAYGRALDIYLDGARQFRLEWGTTIEIDDVGLFHEYRLEALDPATGSLIDTTLVDVQSNEDYSWTIKPAPRLTVTNNWSERSGDKLAVFLDGVFQFALDRGETRMIMTLEFGERFLEAVSLSSGKTIVSTTLKVNANETYEWNIQRVTGQ